MLKRWFCRVQTVKFGSEPTVLSVKELTYKPSAPLEFVDGKCCIFRSKEIPYLESQIQQAHITLSFWTVGYLIFNNPFYMDFPASLPLFFLLEIFILRRYFLKRRTLFNKVSEINLLEDGSSVQFVYQHKFSRVIRNEPASETRFIPDLFEAPAGEHDPPSKAYQFPEFPVMGWSYKFIQNRDKFIVLPSKNSMNQEVLHKVLSGIMIQTGVAK